MRVGLIDVDNMRLKKTKYPNLALMKISAWHKARGDHVEWWNGLEHYNRVYMSKVFSDEYTPDMGFAIQADEVIRGGSGYCIETISGVEHYRPELGADLPQEIKRLQRWCNNKRIFRSCHRFKDYEG